MPQATLDQVISQLDALGPDELQRLEDAVRERLRPAPVPEGNASEEEEDVLDRALLAAGLLTHIPPPRDPSKAERPRITVLGEPVSETILRDRR